MVKYVTVVIYDSTEPGSVKFANIGYAGLIGVLTGFSESGIGIS